ncbi:MAG: tetratricopeptide repeat protein [Saprospiraceae bacterium]|nr:tetratricopeptide repeat protein [Saprospiraceae bacterium]
MRQKIHLYSLLFFLILLNSQCNKSKVENKPLEITANDLSGISKLIENNPNNDSFYILRANLYMLASLHDSAVADIRTAIRIDPENDSHYTLLAENYLLANESKKAIEILDSALLLFPNKIEIIQEKIRLQIILRQYMEAMASLDHLFMLDPQNAYGYYLAGHVFIESEDTGRAVNSYQKAVDLDPELRVGWVQLGDLLSHMNNPLGIQYYNNALRLDSSDLETRHNKAFALQNLGRTDEAIAQYKSNIVADSSFELSYYNLGILYKNLDSLPQAIKMLSRSIELNPEEAYTYFARAECYQKRNEIENARKDYEKAIGLNPEEIEFRKALKKLK